MFVTRTLLLLAALVLLAPPLLSQGKEVLFIGNSYTGVNNLPRLVQDLAAGAGDTLIYQAHTPGGARLLTHAANPTVHGLLASRAWDYVVFQAQSQEPSFPLAQVQTEVFPYARALCDSLRAHWPCASPLFYMTWGRKNGDSRNCASWPPVCTYEGMDSLLNLRYRMMANQNAGLVAPVGAVWNYLRKNHSYIDLYSADGSHPSLAGSYAGACAFYSMIFQKPPTGSSFFAGLQDSVAQRIQLVAQGVVFDSLEKWNVGKFDPVARFISSQSGSTYSFSNQSSRATAYFWDFGDGTTSTLFEPTHTYTRDDTFFVKLIVTRCGKSDTAFQTILHSTVGIPSGISPESIRLFPNPSQGVLFIRSAQSSIFSKGKVVDLRGKDLGRFHVLANGQLPLPPLQPGRYQIILFTRSGDTFTKNLVIH